MTDQLAEIKARRANITPDWPGGKWGEHQTEDQEFGDHAPADIDWLVGEVERLRNDVRIRELEVNQAEAKEHDQAMKVEWLRGLLARLEWSATEVDWDEPDAWSVCPACQGTKAHGHDPGCWLAAELPAGNDEAPSAVGD